VKGDIDCDDIDCDLSRNGVRQAHQLGVTLDAARWKPDYIVCSSAKSAQRTAKEALHQCGSTLRYNGTGRQLYAPKSDEDFAAMWRVRREAAARIELQMVPPEMLYSACRSMFDKTGFFDRFMDETKQILLSLPGIKDARRIAVFSHVIMGNAIAEALFPHHRRTLDTIKLNAGDCIMLTKKECRVFPLMPQPD
jgi:broad specificity phosphatase PhoE